MEIEPKIQGLCHISEFGTRKAMEEALNVGVTKKFQILEINPEEHRMSLKLSGTEAPAATAESKDPNPAPEEKRTEYFH